MLLYWYTGDELTLTNSTRMLIQKVEGFLDVFFEDIMEPSSFFQS